MHLQCTAMIILYSCMVHPVILPIATDPAKSAISKKPRGNPFKTNEEGKLVIPGEDRIGEEAGEGMDLDSNEVCFI